MQNKNFSFKNHLNKFDKFINFEKIKKFEILKKKLIEIKKNKKKIMIAGNGGSSAIASHVSVDLTKNCRIRCTNFNEYDLITCFANDFGYEKWLKMAIEYYFDKGDCIILISSSGTSKNIVNAAKYAKKKGIYLITFSGFDSKNPLRKLGKINFWLNSKDYNIVESVHQIWLLSVVDSLLI